MKHKKFLLKLVAFAVSFALFLHLFGRGIALSRQLFHDPTLLSLAVFLQTGRPVRYPAPVSTVPNATEPPETISPTEPPDPDKPAFSADDLDHLSLIYGCDYRPDLETLLLAPLSWDLSGDEPTVLILHTHATESYTPTETSNYAPSGDRRTLDEAYNMVAIGDRVASILKEAGISVLHDRTFHDYPSYNGSYASARKTIADYLQQYPSIRLVLDIHRDAISSPTGDHLTTSATVNGRPASQLMIVIGTDATGNHHPHWQENLSLALKLTAQWERLCPGITRPIYLRGERFNMDMTPGSLLIEVGASGDTQSQALEAAAILAQGILALAQGTSQ